MLNPLILRIHLFRLYSLVTYLFEVFFLYKLQTLTGSGLCGQIGVGVQKHVDLAVSTDTDDVITRLLSETAHLALAVTEKLRFVIMELA